MDKLDNHIYMVICESTYEIFEETRFGTYRNFCKIIKAEIQAKNISRETKERLFRTSSIIEKFFAMDANSSMRYILDFFLKDKCSIFELPVRYTKELYPMNDSFSKLI